MRFFVRKNNGENLGKKFSRTYKKDLWNMGSGESKSGLGSSINYAKNYINNFNRILQQYDIKNVFDYSCGDWNWMKHVDFGDVSYEGCDIVEDIVEKNQNQFGSDDITFKTGNSVEILSMLPDNSKDLINIRHTLEHLDHKVVMNSIQEAKRVGKYLLVTSAELNNKRVNNTKFISDGVSSRPINLLRSPYVEILPQNFFVEKFYDSKDISTDVYGYLYCFK